MNTKTNEATKRPWTRLELLVQSNQGEVAHCGLGMQQVVTAEANAALIVRAVNQHEALEAVAEAARLTLRENGHLADGLREALAAYDAIRKSSSNGA